jgi:hypothetical protein
MSKNGGDKDFLGRYPTHSGHWKLPEIMRKVCRRKRRKAAGGRKETL